MILWENIFRNNKQLLRAMIRSPTATIAMKPFGTRMMNRFTPDARDAGRFYSGKNSRCDRMADLNEKMYDKLTRLIEVMGNEVTYEVFKALDNDLAEELIERMWSLWEMDEVEE